MGASCPMKARKSLDAVRILRQRDQGGKHGQYRPAALTLHSVILQVPVYHGALTPAEAREAVDKPVRDSRDSPPRRNASRRGTAGIATCGAVPKFGRG